MKTLLKTTLLLLIASLGLAAPETGRQPVSLGDNAALRYWQAISIIPTITEHRDKVDESLTTVMDDRARIACEAAASCLNMFQRARECRDCDWGLVPDGPGTLLPHLAKCREIGRFCCLRIRWRLHTGDQNGAVDDTLALLALARNVAKDGIMIGHLVGISVQSMAMTAIVPELPRLSPDALRRFAQGLDQLPAAPTFGGVLASESNLMIKWFSDGLSAGDKHIEQQFVDAIKQSRPGKIGPALTAEERKTFLDELSVIQKYYAKFAQMETLQPEEFERQFTPLDEQMKRESALAKDFAFSMTSVRYRDAEAHVDRVMLRAAVAVALEGAQRLKDFPDPFGNGAPFTYTRHNGGFELTSKFTHKGAVASRLFGTR